jgi:hypothetical protein
MRPLLDMVNWKSAGHAEPAWWILGRMAGMSESDIGAAVMRRDLATITSRIMD